MKSGALSKFNLVEAPVRARVENEHESTPRDCHAAQLSYFASTLENYRFSTKLLYAVAYVPSLAACAVLEGLSSVAAFAAGEDSVSHFRWWAARWGQRALPIFNGALWTTRPTMAARCGQRALPWRRVGDTRHAFLAAV